MTTALLLQTGTADSVSPEDRARARLQARAAERERVRDLVWSYLEGRLGSTSIEQATSELEAGSGSVTRRQVVEAIYEELRGRRISVAGDGTITALD